MAMIPAGT